MIYSFSIHIFSFGVLSQTYHHAGPEQQVVYGLCDISCVHKVVIGVFVFAVAHLQQLQKGQESRNRNLSQRNQQDRKVK